MNDRFEEKLRHQPFRPVPSSWRREILNATPVPPAAWREWLWPSPVAWGALAAAWVLIALLQLTTPQPRSNGNGAHLSDAAFQQRQLLLTQLLETRL